MVKGRSKLLKELEECSKLDQILYDDTALHRNEVTGEVEQEGDIVEYLNYDCKFNTVQANRKSIIKS